MIFDIRKIGNSRGIIIPKGFIDAFGEKDGTIEMEFVRMSPNAKKITSNSVPVEVTGISESRKKTVEVLSEDEESELVLREVLPTKKKKII